MKNRQRPKDFLSTKEVAEFFGCSERTVHNWKKQKLVPYYKIGHFICYKMEDLMAAIQKCKIE